MVKVGDKVLVTTNFTCCDPLSEEWEDEVEYSFFNSLPAVGVVTDLNDNEIEVLIDITHQYLCKDQWVLMESETLKVEDFV